MAKAPRKPGQPLRNARQEAFARKVAAGASHAAAYRKAGYDHDTPKQGAHQLLVTNSDVKQRIDELKAGAAKRAEITCDDLVRMTIAAHDDAVRDKAHSARIAAIRELGVLTGHRVERRDVDMNATVLGTISERPMPAREFEQRYLLPPDDDADGDAAHSNHDGSTLN